MSKINKLVEKIKTLSIIGTVIFFVTMYLSYSLYSKLNKYSLYVVLLFTTLLTILNFSKIFKLKRKSLIIVLLIIANVFFEVIVNSTGIGSIAIILILLFTILSGDIVNIDKNVIDISCFVILIGDIIFLISDKIYYNTNICGYLAFSMFPFAYNFLLGDKKASKKRKLIGIFFIIPLTIMTLDVIIKSESRAAIMGFSVFFIISIIKNKIFMSKRVYNTFIALILICAIGFVFLYVNLWNNNVDFAIPFTEKSLYSGREWIWSELLEKFEDNYLYGLGSNYNIHSFSELNVHNSLLHILVIYGGINFILFSILFYNILRKTNSYIDNNRYNKIFMATIIGMLIVSFFETNLEWTDVNIYFILSILFCFCNNDRKEVLQNE